MDVAEFIQKAGYKILSLTTQYNNAIKENGESCLWKDIYLLCEAIEVIQSDFITEECENEIMSKLDGKYGLSQMTAPVDGGIGEMTIDPSSDCNVFTIYA